VDVFLYYFRVTDDEAEDLEPGSLETELYTRAWRERQVTTGAHRSRREITHCYKEKGEDFSRW
jgi:hypothetical protein